MTTNELKEASTEQLKAALKAKEDKETKRKARERDAYEQKKEDRIQEGFALAKEGSEILQSLKKLCHSMMDAAKTDLDAYGEIRSTSKGGFSMTNKEGNLRITRRRDTEPNWDERAGKGVDLIRSFLHDTVKKRDLTIFELLMGFLEKNKSGDLEYGQIFSLLKHRDKFKDERWIEGLSLLEQSFSNHLKGYAYEFKTRENADGKWKSLQLNFSSVEVSQ